MPGTQINRLRCDRFGQVICVRCVRSFGADEASWSVMEREEQRCSVLVPSRPHPVLVPPRSKPWAIRTLEHPYPMNPIPDLARNLRGHEPNSGTSSSLYPSRPQPGHGSHYPSSWLSTLVSDALDFNYITLLLQPFLNVPGPLLTSGSHH